MSSARSIRAGVAGRLGREPQDELEAAVVLEAWEGHPADEALPMGAAAFAASAPANVVIESAPPAAGSDRWSGGFDSKAVISDLAFLVSVLTVGFWLSRHGETFGAAAINRSWRLALPVSLAAQWFLRRRAVTGSEGLGRLRREWVLLIPAALAVSGIGLVDRGGPLGALLACLWIGGFLISRRGWGLAYGTAVVLVVAVSTALPSWATSLRVLLLLVGGTACVVVGALRSSVPSERLPGALSRSLVSGAVGGGMGLFLVAEPQFDWGVSGAVSATTIVPSLLASFVGGLWMTQLWRRVPAELRTVTVGTGDRTVLWSGVRLFGEALVAVAAVAALFSMLVLQISGDSSATTRTLLLAHAALAGAGLCVAVLEALGTWVRASAATFAGVATSFSLPSVERWMGLSVPPAGTRILFGALVAVAVGVPAVLQVLASPARRLAAAT